MKSWVIGNWKLNPASVDEVQALVDDLMQGIGTHSKAEDTCHLMLAPSFLHLANVKSVLRQNNTEVKLASQDASALSASSGAFTGEVSAQQLKDLGVEWVIIGHSERRQYFKEDNALLLKKMLNCAAQDLGVILCIGESEAEFESGSTQQVLTEQLAVIDDFIKQIQANDSADLTYKLIVAYEPVWAIGTGKVPSVEQVTEAHNFIAERLQSYESSLVNTPIIYGGSVKPENAADFAASEQINGVLVGGAALNADSFLEIAKAFSK